MFKKLVILSYSTFEITWRALTFFTYLKYMSNNSQPQLTQLKLLHLKLSYSGENADTSGFWSNLFKGNLT